jgi:hypothetical protein
MRSRTRDVPDDVRDTFEKLRQYVKWDLRALFEANHGGNYAAALLMAVACEALSRLLGKSTNFYLTSLFTKHGLKMELAKDVAAALRDGIAHIYDTLFIEAGDLRVELIVSWGAKAHLSRRATPPGIYLNVRTMDSDLSALFQELRARLPMGGELPRRWIKDGVDKVDGRHIPLWREWARTSTEG